MFKTNGREGSYVFETHPHFFVTTNLLSPYFGVNWHLFRRIVIYIRQPFLSSWNQMSMVSLCILVSVHSNLFVTSPKTLAYSHFPSKEICISVYSTWSREGNMPATWVWPLSSHHLTSACNRDGTSSQIFISMATDVLFWNSFSLPLCILVQLKSCVNRAVTVYRFCWPDVGQFLLQNTTDSFCVLCAWSLLRKFLGRDPQSIFSTCVWVSLC